MEMEWGGGVPELSKDSAVKRMRTPGGVVRWYPNDCLREEGVGWGGQS